MELELKKVQLGLKALVYPFNHVAWYIPIYSAQKLLMTLISHSKAYKEQLQRTYVLV